MFNRKLLSLSISMAIGLSASQGFAQANAMDGADTIEEIVIRGVRGSVKSSLAIKQNAEQITDSIVAEDIGKLPDNSVAAALQRVTGVQITRLNGEASGVMVRGLPNLVTTMNGRNIFTTTGRGIALADIPADLLQRVDVKKSSSAQDIEGGIAGVIDVRLRRPFDFDDGLTVAGGLRGEYSDKADATDPIGSITVNNNWSTGAGEFGAMLSVSYQDRQFMDQVNFVTAPDAVTITDPRSAPLNIPGQPSLIPPVAGAYYRHGDRNRTSTNLALQWSPSDTAQYYAEAFYVGYEQDSELNFWVPLPSWGGHVGYVGEYKEGTNVAQTFIRDNAPGTITSNQAFGNSSDTLQAAIGGEWTFENFTLKSDLAYTESTADNRSFILDLAFFAPRITYDFSKDGSGASDVIIQNADGTPYDLSDASQYELWQFFDQHSRQEGEDISWSTDLNYELADTGITSIDAGLRLSQRTAFNQSADTGGRGNISGARVPLTDFPGMESMTPSDLLDSVVDLNTPQWLTPERDYIYNNRVDIRTAMGYGPEEPEYKPELFFDNDEDNYAAYVKANYAFDVGSLPLDGQIGARVVQMDSTLRGTLATSADGVTNYEPVAIDTSDTEVLPSLSARLALRDDLFLRAAAGMTVTRPNFVDLNPATAYFQATETGFAQGTGGNPYLKSVESKNYDLSLEWYFSETNSLSAAIFYRDIDGYIQSYAAEEVKDGVEYFITRPQNTGAGSLEGVELAYTQFFDNLPGLWSGLGVQLNGTFIDGETESPEGEMQPLTNVSDESYNAILLYEMDKISARLAYNWRSGWYESFNAAGAQPGESIVNKDTDSLDLSINYDINDNVTMTLDATNLLDSTYRNYFGGDSSADASLYPRDTIVRDRTVSFGVRFRM